MNGMNPVNAIALSGLNAATLRVQASANNIANMRSNGALVAAAGPAPYTPLEVQQASMAGGGVAAADAGKKALRKSHSKLALHSGTWQRFQ